MVSAESLRFLSWLADPIKTAVRPFPRLNAVMWNTQYRLGMWDYLDAAASGRQAVRLVEEYAPHAKILDLGCGTSASLPLSQASYRRYHGVDISATAVKRGLALGRPNTSFEVADILTYEPSEKYDVIILREVLYYLRPDQIPALLRRMAGHLEPEGMILVSLWAAYANSEVADAVRGCGLPIRLERHWEPDSRGTFIVLGAVKDRL